MASDDSKAITWHDAEREPQCAPNPEFPEGRDLDASHGAIVNCKVDLPYPAKRCGFYRIDCKKCDVRVNVTTAGRPDDPRSVKIECRRIPQFTTRAHLLKHSTADGICEIRPEIPIGTIYMVDPLTIRPQIWSNELTHPGKEAVHSAVLCDKSVHGRRGWIPVELLLIEGQ